MRCIGTLIDRARCGCIAPGIKNYSKTWKDDVAVFFIVLFYFTSLIPTSAQSPLEDFMNRLETIQSEHDKYNEVLRYERIRKDDINQEYANLLSQAIDFYIGNDRAHIVLPLVNNLAESYIFGNQIDHTRARAVLERMEPYVDQWVVDSAIINYYVLSGELNIYMNQSHKAIRDFKVIIDKSLQYGDTLNTNFGYAHLKLAEIYASKWNILESDRYFQNAAAFFMKLPDTTMYLWTLSGQSTLYSNNGLYHEAEELRSELLKSSLESGRIQIVAVAHLSAALEYKDRKMPESQYIHLIKARQYLDYPSDVTEYVKTITYALLAQYFSNQDHVDSTDYYLNKFTQFYIPEKHGPWMQEYFEIARAYQAKVHHQYAKTEHIARNLIRNVRSNQSITKLIRLYELLVNTYSQAGNMSDAFETLIVYNKLRDSLANIQINNQFLYYNQLFEAEKMNKQIIQQDASIQLLSAKNKLLFWRGLWVLFTISGLFLVVYFIRSYRFSRQKSQLQQEFARNLIQEQENERLRISQELHDGISQDLILIKNTLDLARQPEVADMVAGSLTQLRQVSRSLYPVTLKNFGLKAALEQLLIKIDESMPELEVKYKIDDLTGIFSREEELHIYRIVQEATTNILKYAWCDQMGITFGKQKDMYRLAIWDDGIGMDLDNTSFHKGVGMTSMEERSKILGGSFDLRSESGHGTRITVKISVDE